MNAFSRRRPVHAADRHRPRRRRAARVRRRARARLAERARAGGDRRRRRRGARGGRGARRRDGPTYTQVRRRPSAAPTSSSSPRGSAAATTPSSAEAALGVDLNGLALAAALGEPVDEEQPPARQRAGGACMRFLVPRARRARGGRGRRTRRRRSTASSGCAIYPRARRGARRRCGAAPTARARCSRSARAARRRSSALAGRRTAYASSLPMSPQKLSSRRSQTFLGFQPPAVGDEEVAAVAEAIRSGWLTTGPRAAELERALRRVRRREARARRRLRDGGDAPLAGRARDRPRRRGDHDADHVAGDGERDRPHRRDPGLRRRPGRRPERRSRARRRAGHARGRRRSCRCTCTGSRPTSTRCWALGLPVVEDAAHAAESEYRGRKIGGLSDATCFSLYATKSIAAGEGGIVTTNERRRSPRRSAALTIMRRGHGSLYDIAVPGYKANLSDVLAAIALCQLDKVERHRALRLRQVELYDAAVAELDGIEPVGARPARHARAPPLRRPRRRRARGRDARRVPRGARRGEHRHERPLPAGPPADRVPRALPGPAAAAGRRAGRRRGAVAAALARPLGRGHRGRDRGAPPRPRVLHGDETPLDPGQRDARRHRALHRLHPLEDRRRQDARHPPATRSSSTSSPRSRSWSSPSGRWPGAGSSCSPARGIHDRLPLADCAPTSPPTPPVRCCRPRSAATRCGSSRRRAPSGPGRAGRRVGAARAGARRRGDARARRDRLRARDRALRRRRVPLGRARLRHRHGRARGRALLAEGARAAAARPCRSLRRLRVERPVRAVYEGIHGYRDHPWLLAGVTVLTLGDPGGARARDLADAGRPSASTSRRARTT